MNVMKLIYDDTRNSSDLFYKTAFKIPDPVIFFEYKNKTYLILNDLEMERGIREKKVDKILSQREISKSIKSNEITKIINHILLKFKVKELEVPYNFPSFIFRRISNSKIKIRPSESPIFFNSRVTKTKKEIKFISNVMRSTESIMKLVIDKIKYSKPRKQNLYNDGKILTSEYLRKLCQKELVSLGLECPDCIIACGKESALPHHQGSGPIKENQPIVIDIFPRDIETGYFADITRTVVKGSPNQELKNLYNAVFEAQKLGLSLIRSGIKCDMVHDAIFRFFQESGYQTDYGKKTPQGFIHSTGHGLGLDIHEPPRISKGRDILKENYVVTVEPGLYYKKLGGVRIEDTILVTKNGYKNLTKFPKFLKI